MSFRLPTRQGGGRQRPAPADAAARRGLAAGWLAALAMTALLLVAGCSSPTVRDSGPRLALVIGNSAYENAPPLANPVNDANDMCRALERLGFRTLCHTNVRDRAAFEAHVQAYLDQLTPQTAGVVFFSGHGVQAGQANYLMPTQAQLRSNRDDPTRLLYGVNELFDRLRQRPPRFQLVILDACRTDLFGTSAAPTPAPVAKAKAAPAAGGERTPLIRALDSMARAGNGLQSMADAPPSTIVLYATAARDTAFDGEGRNGPLTQHVLANIGTPGQPVMDFLTQVTSGVLATTERAYGKRQTPHFYGSFSGRFCFAGCPGDTTVPFQP